jgi:Protein of unknown function (DUF3108)
VALAGHTTPQAVRVFQSYGMIARDFQPEFDPHQTGRSRAPGLWLVALLGAGLAFVPLLVGQSPARRAPVPPAALPAAEAVVPFHGLERLAFQVLFSKFTVKAAELQFHVVERRNFFGHPAWHFRATAQTVDTVRVLYPLDDQFDSYTDAVRLTSLQYEMYLRESGTKENRTWRMDTGEESIPDGVSAARVTPGTRDPLGMLYVLRATDWKQSPELRMPVFEGRHLYDVRARLAQGSSPVKVPAGQFNASRIDVQVFERGRELTDTTFSVWLADDAGRTPVLIEANLPIGSARVELTGRR